jgi:S1-C subfamily serine protease
MPWLDLVIVGFALLMAVWGYSFGLLGGGMLICGFVVGAFAGSGLGSLVARGEISSRTPALTALLGAVVLAAVLGFLGYSLGSSRRDRLSEGVARADRLAGAGLLVCLALALVWAVGDASLPVRAQSRSPERPPSRIVPALQHVLPDARPALATLGVFPLTRQRIDPMPQIEVRVVPGRGGPSERGSDRLVPPPDGAVLQDPDIRAARRSVVRVVGTACGLGIQASGWVGDEGVVVTNAHVVAGQRDTSVELADGSRNDADVIWYEPKNDLAILRSHGVALARVPPLRLRPQPPPGTGGAILGYPGDGSYRAVPGRLGPTDIVVTMDSYGRGPLERPVSAVRGVVREGNSGGPMVDDRGHVVTTMFLAARSPRRRPNRELATYTGFGVPGSVTRRALARAHRRVGTGPCAG